MSDAAIGAGGELGRQADHHDDRLAARVWPRAMMWSLGAGAALVGAVAAELAVEAREREAAGSAPSLVKVPSQTCSARGLSTEKVTERSRPIRAP